MNIPDPDLEFIPIPVIGSRGQKDTGSRTRNTAANAKRTVHFWLTNLFYGQLLRHVYHRKYSKLSRDWARTKIKVHIEHPENFKTWTVIFEKNTGAS